MSKNNKYIVFTLLFSAIINYNGILASNLSGQNSKSVDIECTTDAECIGIDNLRCVEGVCLCPSGKFLHQDTCIEVSPYLFSDCTIDAQCERLKIGYECDEVIKKCVCKTGWRYLYGRCWPISEYGDSCQAKGQCFHPLQPFSLDCIDEECKCADGYYNRQENECRRISTKLNYGCVLDSDCKIDGVPDAVCSKNLICVDPKSTKTFESDAIHRSENIDSSISRIKLNEACSNNDDCKSLGEAECSKQKHCICKTGYYPNANNGLCLAELGMPVASGGISSCKGAGAVVVDGICDCPVGFFYNSSSNRDCKKPARFFNDSCADDSYCYTFGKAGYCNKQENTVFKTCECDESLSYKDEINRMCVLFNKVVGESCDPDKDICPLNSDCFENECTCLNETIALPDSSVCVETGLELDDPCVIDEQCFTNYSACIDKKCSCMENYFEIEDECKIGINGPCIFDEDCEIENSVCSEEYYDFKNDTEITSICICKEGFIYDNYRECLKIAANFNDECEKSIQCWGKLGDDTSVECINKKCVCTENYHTSSNHCWKKILLGQLCTNANECYVESGLETVECRNSECQCLIGFEQIGPYKCNDSTSIFGSQRIYISWMFLIYVLYNML